jgi:predicted nucleic acid-binding protein
MQTHAKMFVQTLIKYGDIALTYSSVSILEINSNPKEYNKRHIKDFIERYAAEYIGSERNTEILALVSEIMKTGIKAKDATHVAAAIAAKCNYFLTTDKRLLRYKTNKIRLMNPVDFVKEWSEYFDD